MPLVMYVALNNANVKSPLEGGHNPEKPKVKYRSCISFGGFGIFFRVKYVISLAGVNSVVSLTCYHTGSW